LLQRPYSDNREVMRSVQAVLDAVRNEGDEAVRRFTRQFDKADLTSFWVTDEEFAAAEAEVPAALKEAIALAKQNIETFHAAQGSEREAVETVPGVRCWRKSVGIARVGLYIPGGSAPLFSTILMLAVPAVLAGCGEIVLCTPCNSEGSLHPAILYTAQLCGIRKIYKAGGAQAIAALAYGTETLAAVDKIFGPGNQYVTAAKQLVQMEGVAIDMPAGPSEVCVLADETASPAFVAADLLSQAEHGPDSQVLLVTTRENWAEEVLEAVEAQRLLLPRAEIARQALQHSKVLVLPSMEEAMELVNQYAAEHLIISCREAERWAGQVQQAGSVFIGPYSPESAGDYASGTNHTLPTNGFARAYSGVSLDSFVKKITFQQLSRDGLHRIGPAVMAMAEAEGLQAHAEAVRIRLSGE
jgi:histidinol dehydrogenase